MKAFLLALAAAAAVFALAWFRGMPFAPLAALLSLATRACVAGLTTYYFTTLFDAEP